MSERFEECRQCNGTGFIQFRDQNKELVNGDCNACDGQGFDGSTEAWLRKEDETDQFWQDTMEAYNRYV